MNSKIMHNRVFITGISALTACGNTAQQTWEAVWRGQSGIAKITQWDIASWTHNLGGELKNFYIKERLPDRKLQKLISRQDAIGINAAMQAIQDSAILDYRSSLNYLDSNRFNAETAIYVGSPGNKYFQQYDFLPVLAKTNGDMQKFGYELFNEVHPMWLLRILPNNVLAYTGITYGFKGCNHNIANHAVGGSQAILEAYHGIKSGKAQRAIVIAYDIGIEPQALFYYEKLGIISARHLKPFAKEHDGTILAEGAAAVILESEASASQRQAKCYGEILGGIVMTEAAGMFALQNDGQALTNLIHKALQKHFVAPNAVDFIIAHGNGNIASDNSEAKAILRIFDHVPITAFKWAMGHTLVASGIVDTVLATYVLAVKCLPGIANFTTPAAGCENLNLSVEHRNLKRGKIGIIINRGFASMNSCLIIKSCD